MRVVYFFVAMIALLFESDRVDLFVCWVIDAFALITFCMFLAVFGTAALAVIFN